MKLKLLLIISLIFNVYLMSSRKELAQEKLALKREFLERSSEMAIDQTKITQSIRKRAPIKAPKRNFTNNFPAPTKPSIKAESAPEETSFMGPSDDDGFINEKLVSDSSFSPEDIEKIEEIKEDYHTKLNGLMESFRDEPFRPNRDAGENKMSEQFKNSHGALKKALGEKKYEAYMSVLDQFNDAMDEKRKNGAEEVYYRGL